MVITLRNGPYESEFHLRMMRRSLSSRTVLINPGKRISTELPSDCEHATTRHTCAMGTGGLAFGYECTGLRGTTPSSGAAARESHGPAPWTRRGPGEAAPWRWLLAHREEAIERHRCDEIDEEPRPHVVGDHKPKDKHRKALATGVVVSAKALEDDVEGEEEIEEVVCRR